MFSNIREIALRYLTLLYDVFMRAGIYDAVKQSNHLNVSDNIYVRLLVLPNLK